MTAERINLSSPLTQSTRSVSAIVQSAFFSSALLTELQKIILTSPLDLSYSFNSYIHLEPV